MIFLSPIRLFTILVTLTHLTTAMFNATLLDATPPRHNRPALNIQPAPPHFVIYWDQWISGETGPPDVSNFLGYNVVWSQIYAGKSALCFLLTYGAADQALQWSWIDPATRASILTQYHDAGVLLIVSAFGATDAPTSAGWDPTSLANTMADWVQTYGLDGIDVDYEDFNAVALGTAADWLTTFTTVLRQRLPEGQYIITHAPIAPWFSSTTGGPYLTVDTNVGSLIDWYNVQFYSQGDMYTTCDGLVFNSGGPYTQSSIFEISASGVELDKIVMGKPATPNDASGYVDPNTLATCVAQGQAAGWSGGVMVWQYPNADSSWIQTVRSQSWPVLLNKPQFINQIPEL